MKSALPLYLIAILLLSVPFATAQQNELKFSEHLTLKVPSDWKFGNQTRDSLQIYVPLQKQRTWARTGEIQGKEIKPKFVINSEAGMMMIVEHRRNHPEAIRRLAEIMSEYPEPATPLIIGGWPAIERRYRSIMPQPGQDEARGGSIETLFATTAIAAGDEVFRFDTMFAPDADPRLLDQALEIARNVHTTLGPADVSKRELEQMQRMIQRPAQPSAPPPQQRRGPTPVPKRGSRGEKPGLPPVQIQTGNGELEVTTNDGQHMVVATNNGYSYSDNFGGTYTLGGGTPCDQTRCDGDPSLAVGHSGDIYYAWIGGPTLTSLGDGVSRSIDNGHTFNFRGLAATCPGTTTCTVADQEHIAADITNASSGGGDRVYNVWRDFATANSIRISCSTDGAAAWTAGTAIAAGVPPPRVSVGSDGFVYVAWGSGGNMMLHKYSNCDSGLTAQVGWPVTVAAFTNVACPLPGVDRCNGRNILSSPKVAVDDLDPNHIYYVFATSTAAGNEDIMVFDSPDGGATFPRSVRINNAVAARRFMPWISVYGGVSVVTWYDRRHATAGSNDLTRFFRGGAAVRGPNLVALAEQDLSGIDDNECSTWPWAPDNANDSESCSTQPQLAGCCSSGGSCPFPLGPRCDFTSGPACPVGQSCITDRGAPKYGDYNGNAAGAGRLYSAWASSVPPTSVGGAGGQIRVYASADQIPSDFYVRDWNASPDYDRGNQPSTHAVFWETSDVWNQSTNATALPGPDGSVAGDPPDRTGSNFAFARVSRRAAAMSAAPDATVTVNFFLGDYGLGAGFSPIGSETVTLAAADMIKITPAHAWSVPVGASNHLCLAVQIDGPDGDTSALPSISGTAPGPADPFVLTDNNKAQRNLQDTIGTGASGTELIAMIRNAEKTKRLMRLRVKLPPGPGIVGTFDVIGGRSYKVSSDTRIEIGDLNPGEIRWLRFRATSLAEVDKPIHIQIFEDTSPPANGFTILLHRASAKEVMHRTLADLASVMSRVSKIEKNRSATSQSEIARRATQRLSIETYIAYFKQNIAPLQQIVTVHLRWTREYSHMRELDMFQIEAAAKDLMAATDRKDMDRIASASISLVERLDAHLTALMRARGK